MFELSVIICSHNPRPDYLRRTLEGLRRQSLSHAHWELLLIDNASDEPLPKTFDLSWHPAGRHFREEKLGLTPARLRAIEEAQSNLLLFVDDDNILDKDYLRNALRIAASHPFLGVFGAATIEPEFELQPPPEFESYLVMLALRREGKDVWSNDLEFRSPKPYGAGLCVTRKTAEAFAYKTKCDGRRLRLGRKGSQLASCEDLDIAYAAVELGLGYGIFAALKLIHLISAARVDERYLLRLQSSMAESHTLLHYIWHGTTPERMGLRLGVRGRIKRCFKGEEISDRFLKAYISGQRRAFALVETLKSEAGA